MTKMTKKYLICIIAFITVVVGCPTQTGKNSEASTVPSQGWWVQYEKKESGNKREMTIENLKGTWYTIIKNKDGSISKGVKVYTNTSMSFKNYDSNGKLYHSGEVDEIRILSDKETLEFWNNGHVETRYKITIYDNYYEGSFSREWNKWYPILRAYRVK